MRLRYPVGLLAGALSMLLVPLPSFLSTGGQSVLSDFVAHHRHNPFQWSDRSGSGDREDDGQSSGQGQAPIPIPAGSCTLKVPANPLSAEGLSTPWELGGGCLETDPNNNAFIQAAIFDPETNKISTYSPLVITAGTQPAAAPTEPDLPDHAVVSIVTGFNGGALFLTGSGASRCIEGSAGTLFGQNSFCNMSAFYKAVKRAISAGKVTVPALGTAKDGLPCPTTRDFSVTDQDQSDNVTSTYLVTATGQLAQNIPANVAKFPGATTAFNGSDERLLSVKLDGTLGCTPWAVPDLADPSGATKLPMYATNELMAAARQAPPVALIPANDPFTLVNGNQSLQKLNAYRAGADQPLVSSLSQADSKSYCEHLLSTGLPRIQQDMQFTNAVSSPFPMLASTFFNFLALRYMQTFQDQPGFMHCTALLNVQNPVNVTTDANGVVTSATITLNPPPLPVATPSPAPSAAPAATPSVAPASGARQQ